MKKVATLATTLSLFILCFCLGLLHNFLGVELDPPLDFLMLTVTGLFYLLSSVFLYTHHYKCSAFTGIATFIVLCACVIYIESIVDAAVFTICMAVLVRKASEAHETAKKFKV